MLGINMDFFLQNLTKNVGVTGRDSEVHSLRTHVKFQSGGIYPDC